MKLYEDCYRFQWQCDITWMHNVFHNLNSQGPSPCYENVPRQTPGGGKCRLCSLLPHAQHEIVAVQKPRSLKDAYSWPFYLIAHDVLLCLLEKFKATQQYQSEHSQISRQYALYYTRRINNLMYVGILGGDETGSTHLLSRWLERLHINQTEDISIPISGTVRMVVVFDWFTQLISQIPMAYLWSKKMEDLNQGAVEVFNRSLAQTLSTGFLLWDWKISWSIN